MTDSILRLLIVDDEPLARLRLRDLVAELMPEQTVVVAEAGDAGAAMAALAVPIDAVLLDIGLPGRDGLRLAQALKALPQPPAVVFVTAHTEHALTAFELDAVDYLTKPVRRERLVEAMRRVRERHASAAARQAGPGVRDESAGLRPEPAPLVVSERGRMLRLPQAEVIYLRDEHKALVLRTARASYVIDGALADFEQRLGADFIRVHRNALVARTAIRALELRPGLDDDPDGEGWAVNLAPVDEWLAVSRRQVGAVRAALAAPTPPISSAA